MGKPYGGDRRLGRTVTHGLAISHLRWIKRTPFLGGTSLTVFGVIESWLSRKQNLSNLS
jgi:hypothetical protein